jgi:gamma-glutamylcyclotransferase (GGCT)/AIG2-like uncharacterized protein YtfP
MKYFAYGMNTNLDSMRIRCPGARVIGVGWLDDYEFVFRTHADIQKEPGSICYGVLWEINTAHLRSLDMLEGYPHYYTRFKIPVNFNNKKVKAYVYQMNDQEYVSEPSAGYLDMVTEGYTQNGVPINQIDTAINMVSCYTSPRMTVEYPFTWLPTIRDCV